MGRLHNYSPAKIIRPAQPSRRHAKGKFHMIARFADSIRDKARSLASVRLSRKEALALVEQKG